MDDAQRTVGTNNYEVIGGRVLRRGTKRGVPRSINYGKTANFQPVCHTAIGTAQEHADMRSVLSLLWYGGDQGRGSSHRRTPALPT